MPAETIARGIDSQGQAVMHRRDGAWQHCERNAGTLVCRGRSARLLRELPATCGTADDDGQSGKKQCSHVAIPGKQMSDNNQSCASAKALLREESAATRHTPRFSCCTI